MDPVDVIREEKHRKQTLHESYIARLPLTVPYIDTTNDNKTLAEILLW